MSFVYVIGAKDAPVCKIGFSEDPARRLKQLQTGHPDTLEIFHLETVPDQHVRLVERTVHNNLRHLRQKGEWFGLPAENAIRQVQFVIIDLSLD